MLAIQKNSEVSQKLERALERLKSLNISKETFFSYLIKMNSLEKTHAKKIWNSMTEFEEKVVKLTFYSSEKVKRILNFTKIYRQFSYHWERISKVNICNLQQLSNNEIETSEKVVRQKAQLFFQELKTYIQEQDSYNGLYVVYQSMCGNLKQDIQKIKSYSDPLCFYNQKFTSEFLQKLKKKFDNCNNEETKLKTQTQMLDQKRHYLSESLIEVKQAYVPIVQKILKTLYLGVKQIIDPSKDQAIQKEDFKLRKNNLEEQRNYEGRVQNLLNSQTQNAIVQDEDKVNIFQDFKELFQNRSQIIKCQITSDEKFFYDRCQSIKTKKMKRSNEILSIQKLLINELKTQLTNLKRFQTELRKNQKQIFGSDGSQTFSKKFRKYFGKNFHELYELCLLITEKRRTSIQKICKIIESSQQKLSSTFKQKKQKLKFFQNRTDFTLGNHKKIKDKVQSSHFSSNQLIREYKSNVLSTYEDFAKNYKDLQCYQNEMDKIFFKSLQQISDLILKEAINKSLIKIVEKQKNRIQIFRQLNLNVEAQTNFYEDAKYQIFFSEQIQPNLSKKFKSEINVKDFQETKNTLLQKEYTLTGMIKHKITCCGVKSEPLTRNVKQSFECYLINMKTNKTKIMGCLNILSNGINFSQKSMNPFSNLLQIILPSKDIDSYKTQVVQQTSVLTIGTKKGPVYFYGKQIASIFESMLKNIGVKTLQKESSDKNGRNLSGSSSFLGNSANSQSFRIQFQKSTSSSINRLQNMNSPSKIPLKNNPSKVLSDNYSSSQILQKLQLKLMLKQFLSENFNLIPKQLPIKDESRFNYNYKNKHHKFLLKQKKRSSLNKKVLSFDYSWKVSFPQNAMLKSFKHYETVYVQLQKTQVKIHIVHGINLKNVSLAQKIFYDEIFAMNQKLTEFIVSYTERPGDIIIEPDQQQSIQSQFNLDPDDIVVNFDRETSTVKNMTVTGDNFFKNSKLQRSQSNFTIISGKN